MSEFVASGTLKDSSRKKQQLLNRYAAGEISWKEVSSRLSDLVPPVPERGMKWKLGMVAVWAIGLCFIPFQARREDA